MRRLDHGSLLLAALSVVAGCYESHTLPLDGERWTCRCHWTVQLPEIDFECEIPIGGGDPECGIMTGVGTGSLTTHDVFETIHVCTTFADPSDDPAYVCNDACSDPQFQPFGTVGSEVVEDESSYLDHGQCSTGDDPPFTYIFPSVPADAVRNGQVVAELSTLELTVEGEGTTPVVHPVDGTPVSIQGGNCGSGRCPLSITNARVEIAEDVALGDFTLLGLNMQLSGALPFGAEVRADPSELDDSWELLATTPENSVMPWEFLAAIDGLDEVVPGTFDWEHPIAVPDDGPGGPFNLRPSSPDKFMMFRGIVRDEFALAEDDIRDLTLVAEIVVRFFSGAPVPDMAIGRATEGLIVDAGGTTDDLGGPAEDYEWLAMAGDIELLLARGKRAFLTNGMVRALQRANLEICLRVHDTDGMYDTVCRGKETPEEPTDDEPRCPEIGLTPAGGSRFHALAVAAGVEDLLYQVDNVTWLVPLDDAFKDVSDEEFYKLLEPEQRDAAKRVVLAHVLNGRHDLQDLLKGVNLDDNLAGEKVDVDSQSIGESARVFDVDCLGGTVHLVGRLLPTSFLSP